MSALPILAVIMRGHRTVRERSEYSMTVLSHGSARDRTQLKRLSQELKEKRPQYQERHDKVIIQHDNSRPHVARPVKTYLEMLK